MDEEQMGGFGSLPGGLNIKAQLLQVPEFQKMQQQASQITSLTDKITTLPNITAAKVSEKIAEQGVTPVEGSEEGGNEGGEEGFEEGGEEEYMEGGGSAADQVVVSNPGEHTVYRSQSGGYYIRLPVELDVQQGGFVVSNSAVRGGAEGEAAADSENGGFEDPDAQAVEELQGGARMRKSLAHRVSRKISRRGISQMASRRSTRRAASRKASRKAGRKASRKNRRSTRRNNNVAARRNNNSM